MEKYNIIQVLKAFSKDELKRFSLFLNSPFFNKSKKLIDLYNSLIVFYPDFNSKKLTEEKLFSKISPGAVYKKATLLNLFSDLLSIAEKFMAIINFEKKNFEMNDMLREELINKNLKNLLKASLKKQELKNDILKVYNPEYFVNQAKLMADKVNYQIVFVPKNNIDEIAESVNNITERGAAISSFFAIEMIKTYTNLLVRKRTFTIEEDKNFIFSMFNSFDFEKFFELVISGYSTKINPTIIKIYRALYLTVSRFDEEKYYFEYKNLVFAEINKIDTDEIRFHTIQLLKYCMDRSDTNEEKRIFFDKERFKIFNLILDNEYYKSSLNTYMPVELYRTILLLGLKLKKYTWTFDFIKKSRLKLSPDRRVNIYNYGCAKYYFSRGKYADAMKSFHKVKYDHFMFKIDLKNMLIKTYYELGLYENALSQIDTYRHFLVKNKTLSVKEKRMNKNFIDTVQKMIRFLLLDNRNGKFSIEYELKKVFSEKEWVLEKFSQLDNKFKRSA
ncbi:MAG: hypothetical protein IPM96_06435 [Ignavibacteria bacterium]|nr:hypothetical protein [Ignavibacteria bacterium]